MFKNTYQLGNIPNFFHRQIAHTSLFQMRYDSLVNSKKWPSESSKGSGISTFCQSDSVKLFCLHPNYYFSNFHCSSLEWQNFLKFDLVDSKCPKFNKWSKFLKNVSCSRHFRPLKLGVLSWHSEWCLALPYQLNILFCCSVTPLRTASCHSSMCRGEL